MATGLSGRVARKQTKMVEGLPQWWLVKGTHWERVTKGKPRILPRLPLIHLPGVFFARCQCNPWAWPSHDPLCSGPAAGALAKPQLNGTEPSPESPETASLGSMLGQAGSRDAACD